MLALFELTLRGTPFIFQGQEIGMTNFDFTRIEEVNDVESHGLNKLMKKFGIPKALRWKWIKASSRDNNRTPVQWDDSENAGFTKGKPWLGINSNYKKINYASQKNDPDSVLSFYKKLIALRKESRCLVHGDFIPIYADNRIMIYQRRCAAGNAKAEEYTVALNFSNRTIKIPKNFACLFSGTLITSASGEQWDGSLLPWDGVLIKNI